MVTIRLYVFIHSKLNRQSCSLVDRSTSCNGRPGGLEMNSPQMRALDIAARFIERWTGFQRIQKGLTRFFHPGINPGASPTQTPLKRGFLITGDKLSGSFSAQRLKSWAEPFKSPCGDFPVLDQDQYGYPGTEPPQGGLLISAHRFICWAYKEEVTGRWEDWGTGVARTMHYAQFPP